MLLSIMIYHRIWITVPCVYSRTLLFIHSLYTGLHLLIPPSTPSLPQPTGPFATTHLFSLICFVLIVFCGCAQTVCLDEVVVV